MIMNITSGNNFEAKQEGGDGNNTQSKLSSRISGSSASTSRQWGGFKNPRIVRVSRSFGGKDRHSKVCTIRGLRDRRIRLSVPTAIQLYDLQDRLGLSQPSKVVDWLLDATKLEIDKLPPLQFPPGSFTMFDDPSLSRSIPHHHHQESLPLFSHHDEASIWRGKSQETGLKIASGKEKWIEENQDGVIAYNNGVVPQLSAQNFFPLGSQACFPAALLNSNSSSTYTLPYNSYYHWEPSSLSLAQFHDSQNNNNPNLYLPSILPPPYMAAAAAAAPTPPEADPRHLSTHFHHLLTTSSSSSSPQHHNHHHLIQNPLIPPTLHFINSPMKSFALNAKDPSSLPDNNNNPEKGSRCS